MSVSLSLHIYIYIYIYMSVSLYVCLSGCPFRYMLSVMKKYDGKKLRDASKENLELLETEEEKREEEEEKKSYEATIKKVKEVLGDKVDKVTVSHRLTRSPCVLVTSEVGWSANMERFEHYIILVQASISLFAAHASRVSHLLTRSFPYTVRVLQKNHEGTGAEGHFDVVIHAEQKGQRNAHNRSMHILRSEVPRINKLVCCALLVFAYQTMELNPHHRIVRAIKQRVDEGRGAERTVTDLVWLLYDTALLVSGFSLPDPAAYANRIHSIVAAGLGLEGEEDEGVQQGQKDAGMGLGGAKSDDMPPLVDEQQKYHEEEAATVMEEVD